MSTMEWNGMRMGNGMKWNEMGDGMAENEK